MTVLDAKMRIESMTISETRELAVALASIAVGRTDCGRPLAAEKARQVARRALSAQSIDWTQLVKGARRG